MNIEFSDLFYVNDRSDTHRFTTVCIVKRFNRLHLMMVIFWAASAHMLLLVVARLSLEQKIKFYVLITLEWKASPYGPIKSKDRSLLLDARAVPSNPTEQKKEFFLNRFSSRKIRYFPARTSSRTNNSKQNWKQWLIVLKLPVIVATNAIELMQAIVHGKVPIVFILILMSMVVVLLVMRLMVVMVVQRLLMRHHQLYSTEAISC